MHENQSVRKAAFPHVPKVEQAARIVVVDDDEQMRFFLREALQAQGYEAFDFQDVESALPQVKRKNFDLVILDMMLPGMSGIDAIQQFKQLDPDVVVILMSGYGSRNLASEAIQLGAYDFFTKPLNLKELEVIMGRALEKKNLLREISRLRTQLHGQYNFSNIVGKSKAIQEIFDLMERVVESDSTILITGESGTGKELIAEAIHYNSPRKDGPFIRLNCAAIPDELLESELFGHEKGSFTGAIERKRGKFELADGGTILLDEIADMSIILQAKILRVLQDKEFQRVGGSETIRVDVRVLASTNQDLRKAMEEKRFREDLYYRLNVIHIHVPPLRNRKSDILPLAEHYLRVYREKLNKEILGLQPEVIRALTDYDWPGNVRELRNCIEYAVNVTTELYFRLQDLPSNFHIQLERDLKIQDGESLDDLIGKIERKILVDTLKRVDCIQAEAARILGVTERSIWHRIKKYQIDVKELKNGG